jgi:kinesin family protein 6/9
MSKSKGIEVYVRIKPTKKPDNSIKFDMTDAKIEFTFTKDALRNLETRQEYYGFQFNGILDMLTRQETVFESIAKDVVESAFDGYNGTIFAYGQTGSGKTFTMTGGAERYADRGLIPRTLSYIFGRIKKTTTHQHKVNVSYLEIYNNSGYDLLDENHASKNLSDLPKV